MCFDTYHTYIHTCTNSKHAVRGDCIYNILTMMLEKNLTTILKNDKSEIVEGVCDKERREKMPP